LKNSAFNKRFTVFVLVIFTSVILVSCASSQVQSQSSDRKNRPTIAYTGVGADLDGAKADAIRSALSIQIPQYVIADRKVVNSELERDVTISTMSGYITSFEIIDQYKDVNGFVVVTALIDVSENKIRNYAASRFEIISTNQGSDRFDGKNIANKVLAAKRKKEAEAARKTQQYKAAKQLAERLFAGYPFNVVEVNVTDVDFDPDYPERIRVGISYDLNEEWRKSFWRKVELIDQLLTDSDRRDNIKICANSGSVLDGCKRIPRVELSFIDNNPPLQHSIVVPVYGPNGRYESCFFHDIYPPIGLLSREEQVSGNVGDLAVGIGALTAGTVAVTGAVAVGTAAAVAALPFQILGALVNSGDGSSEIEYEEPELEWLEPSKIIYILGPNPLSVDFKAGKFNPRLVWWDGWSSRLYSEKKAATEYRPFVIAREGGNNYFINASENKRKFSQWSKGPPADLCKQEGIRSGKR
jgi:hypothetical protein